MSYRCIEPRISQDLDLLTCIFDTGVSPKEEVAVLDVFGLESNLETYQNGGFQNDAFGVSKNGFGQELRHNLKMVFLGQMCFLGDSFCRLSMFELGGVD